MPIPMSESPFSLNFTAIGSTAGPPPQGFQVELHPADVHGFDATIEPTQADADAVAQALDRVYAEMPATQRAILTQLMQQASQVSV